MVLQEFPKILFNKEEKAPHPNSREDSLSENIDSPGNQEKFGSTLPAYGRFQLAQDQARELGPDLRIDFGRDENRGFL